MLIWTTPGLLRHAVGLHRWSFWSESKGQDAWSWICLWIVAINDGMRPSITCRISNSSHNIWQKQLNIFPSEGQDHRMYGSMPDGTTPCIAWRRQQESLREEALLSPAFPTPLQLHVPPKHIQAVSPKGQWCVILPTEAVYALSVSFGYFGRLATSCLETSKAFIICFLK